MRGPRWVAIVLLGAACHARPDEQPAQDVLAQMRPGMWVEAKGKVEAGVPVVQEVDEVPRGESDKKDKVEITAAVDAATPGRTLTVIGRDVLLTDDTEWADQDKKAVPPFAPQPGDWLRVKARLKDDATLHAREVRAMAPRDRFQVMGEIDAVDLAERRLSIASIGLRTAADVGFDDITQAEAERDLHEDPLALFFADERKGVPFTLRPFARVWFGGEVSGQVGNDDEYDLDRTDSGDRGLVETAAKADMLWRIDDRGSFALVEGQVGYRHRARAGSADTYSQDASLSRAYAYLKLTEEVRLQLGRQDFDEEREWLYDERLDAARLHVRSGRWHVEVGAAAGRDFADDDDSTRDRSLLTGLVRCHVTKKHWLTAYWLDVDDGTAANLEPTLYGLRSFSRPWQGLGHWAELAHATGNAGSKDIDGWAFDVGLLWRFAGLLRPSVYAGYAYAPGKAPNDPESGFRQSSFQDNNSKFGGVTSFKYYGEIALPELSNIDVTTLGLGVRPGSFSADVVFHTYRQDYLATTWLGTDVRADPNGRFADLGYEIDLILGYRHLDRLSAEVVLGRFDPGSAFDESDPAYKAEAQLRLKF